MLCPHRCMARRLEGKTGRCRTGGEVYLASHSIHFGEEPPISGYSGSGTLFFTSCNLSCVFCQNYPISQLNNGNLTSVHELAHIMLNLQKRGVHNINFVTPTHVLPQVIEAALEARSRGLTVPFVYNSGGYEDAETLKLLDGIIDIYMPDAKYSDDKNALAYSGAEGYTTANRKTLKEMHRQVGDLVIDKAGIARRGLLVRHLVLPNGIAGSRAVLEFIAREISPSTYLSIMSQYHPAHKTDRYPELSRSVTPKEYRAVLKVARTLGLTSGWQQEI